MPRAHLTHLLPLSEPCDQMTLQDTHHRRDGKAPCLHLSIQGTPKDPLVLPFLVRLPSRRTPNGLFKTTQALLGLWILRGHPRVDLHHRDLLDLVMFPQSWTLQDSKNMLHHIPTAHNNNSRGSRSRRHRSSSNRMIRLKDWADLTRSYHHSVMAVIQPLHLTH